jgi:hypothetical protein
MPLLINESATPPHKTFTNISPIGQSAYPYYLVPLIE